MLQKVIEYLKKQNWVYSQGRKENILTLTLGGNNGFYHCAIDVREDISLFLFISYMAPVCPPEKRAEMAQLLCQINSNLLYGNFEMDLFDGVIKCRTGMYYNDIELNDKLIDNVISRNTSSMDISSVHFAKFMYGNISIPEVYNILYPAETHNLIEENSNNVEHSTE